MEINAGINVPNMGGMVPNLQAMTPDDIGIPNLQAQGTDPGSRIVPEATKADNNVSDGRSGSISVYA